MNTMHATTIVRRPFDQVRPICSCGWLGTSCRNVADAEEEAKRHKTEEANLEGWLRIARMDAERKTESDR
jgi:hypothetical protein